jgi:hypothetical protein
LRFREFLPDIQQMQPDVLLLAMASKNWSVVNRPCSAFSAMSLVLADSVELRSQNVLQQGWSEYLVQNDPHRADVVG